MVRRHMAGFRKPEQRDLRQHPSFEGNRVGQNNVERRQAVGGDNQQMLGVHIVDVTHFSLMNFFKGA